MHARVPPLLDVFSCSCKGYWGHESCSHTRFVERVHLNVQPVMVFSAAALRDAAFRRKRSATAALEHQPEDATRQKASRVTASSKSSQKGGKDGRGGKGGKGGTGGKGGRGGRGGRGRGKGRGKGHR